MFIILQIAQRIVPQLVLEPNVLRLPKQIYTAEIKYVTM